MEYCRFFSPRREINSSSLMGQLIRSDMNTLNKVVSEIHDSSSTTTTAAAISTIASSVANTASTRATRKNSAAATGVPHQSHVQPPTISQPQPTGTAQGNSLSDVCTPSSATSQTPQLLVLTIALATSHGDEAVQLLAPGYALGYASQYAKNYAQPTPPVPATTTSSHSQHDQILPISRSAPQQHQDNEVQKPHATSPRWDSNADGEQRILFSPHPPVREPYDAEPILSTTARAKVNTEADNDKETLVMRLDSKRSDEHATRARNQQEENIQSHDEPPIHTSQRPSVQADNVPNIRSGRVTWPREPTDPTVNVVSPRTLPRLRSSTPNDVQTTPRHPPRARQRIEDSLATPRSGDRQSPRRERVPTPVDTAARRHPVPQRHVRRPYSTAPPVTPTLSLPRPPALHSVPATRPASCRRAPHGPTAHRRSSPSSSPPRAPPRRDTSERSTSRRAEQVTPPLPPEKPPPTRAPGRDARKQTAHPEEVHQARDSEDDDDDIEVIKPTLHDRAGNRREIANTLMRDNVREDAEDIVVPRESKGFYARLFESVGDHSTSGTNEEFGKSTKEPPHKSELSDHTHRPEIETKKSADKVVYSNEQQDIKPNTKDNRKINTEEVDNNSPEQRDKYPSQLKDHDDSERLDRTGSQDHHSDHRNTDRSLDIVHDTANKYNDMKEYHVKDLPQTHGQESNREHADDHSIKNNPKD
ncbi:Protein of unknown function, partial [Gryllus bimaculatus]